MRARSILAVVVGYLIFAVSVAVLFGVSGQDPHVFPSLAFLTFSTLCGVGFALLAGVVAVRIGTERSGVDVAGLIAASAVVSMVVQWRAGSIWSQITVLLFMVPAAIVGGGLAQTRRS
jgi:hypothetical protein